MPASIELSAVSKSSRPLSGSSQQPGTRTSTASSRNSRTVFPESAASSPATARSGGGGGSDSNDNDSNRTPRAHATTPRMRKHKQWARDSKSIPTSPLVGAAARSTGYHPFSSEVAPRRSPRRRRGSAMLSSATHNRPDESANATLVLQRKHGQIMARASIDMDNDIDVITQRLCVISQTSTFCVVWDISIFVAVAWIAVIMPLQIAFNDDLSLFWNSKAVVWIDLIIDLLFWADVMVSFRTSYVDYSGEEILDPRSIAKHYAGGYFAIDLISCLPGFPINIEEMLERLATDDDALPNWDAAFELAKIGKTSKLLRTARLVKAIRLIKIKKLSNFLEDRYNIDISRFRVFGLLFLAILLGHLFSCFFIFCSGDPTDDNYRFLYSWERNAGVVDASASTTYLSAFYWAMATMTTVGYGDISAETNSEMAFSIVAMASGGIFYGYMIANISNLVNNKDQNDRRYVEKMNEIRAYMGARRVPKDLRRKMMSYYKHYFATKTALNESRILNDLPQGLQKAMRIHLAQDTLDSLPFFKSLNDTAMTALLRVLKPIHCAAGDILIEAGAEGSEMFFLISGQMAIVSRRSHELVGELTAVTSFNEIAMLRPLFGIKSIYSTTIVAKTDCDLYCLSNTDMLTALSHAPRVIQNIMEGAVDKYMHILHKGSHANPGGGRFRPFHTFAGEQRQRQRGGSKRYLSDDLASVNGGGAGVSIYAKSQRKRTESPGVESDGEDEETKIMHFLSGVHTGKQAPMLHVVAPQSLGAVQTNIPTVIKRSKSWKFIKDKVLAMTRQRKQKLSRQRSMSDSQLDKSPMMSMRTAVGGDSAAKESLSGSEGAASAEEGAAAPDPTTNSDSESRKAALEKQRAVIFHMQHQRAALRIEEQKAQEKAEEERRLVEQQRLRQKQREKRLAQLAESAADSPTSSAGVSPAATPTARRHHHQGARGSAPSARTIPSAADIDDEAHAKEGLLKVAASMAAHHTNYTTYHIERFDDRLSNIERLLQRALRDRGISRRLAEASTDCNAAEETSDESEDSEEQRRRQRITHQRSYSQIQRSASDTEVAVPFSASTDDLLSRVPHPGSPRLKQHEEALAARLSNAVPGARRQLGGPPVAPPYASQPADQERRVSAIAEESVDMAAVSQSDSVHPQMATTSLPSSPLSRVLSDSNVTESKKAHSPIKESKINGRPARSP